MDNNTRFIQLKARVIFVGEIEAKTGLHIGGSPGALAIGNVDMPVIRNLRDGKPYIPGSSLKGKMRSLCEKYTNAPQNTTINKGKNDGSGKVVMHTAKSREEYEKYWVNPIFGVTGDAGEWTSAPSRLVVRDIPITEASAKELEKALTDMPYTEVKWEAAIDRVTSAATPRQVERVPAGTVFGPMELVFSLYNKDDVSLLGHILTALQLVEDDYLGGLGSRGSGKIAFRKMAVQVRAGVDYQLNLDHRFSDLTLNDLSAHKQELLTWVTGFVAK